MKLYNSSRDFLMLALILIIAFTTLDPRRSDITDDVFKPFKEKFDKIFKTDSKSLPVHFGDLPGGGVIGMCLYYARFNKREIIISEKWWKHSDTIEHELLIFHELSHCVLDEDHRDGNIILEGETIPKSIMNSYIIDEDYYIRYPVYYIEEIKANVGDAKDL